MQRLALLLVAVTAFASPALERSSSRPAELHQERHGSLVKGNIIHGDVAEPGSTPWLVSIQDTQYTEPVHFCGATILSHHWIVTAASCVYPYVNRNIQVVLGEYDFHITEGYEKSKKVIKIVFHPEFNYFELPAYDIALLLVYPFTYNDRIQPMPLLPSTLPSGPPPPLLSHPAIKACHNRPVPHDLKGEEGLIAGWGQTEEGSMSSLVREATMTILANEECQEAYPQYKTESLMCAANLTYGSVDACNGDTGGGLISKDGFLLGIYTYEPPCGQEDYPGLYVNISKVQDWICDVIKGHNEESFSNEKGFV